MTMALVHAGIDISKDTIDICLRDGNRCSWRKVATLRQEPKVYGISRRLGVIGGDW